jgi:hypothetical protein
MALLHDLIDFGEAADILSRDYFARLHDIADAEAHAAIHRHASVLRDTSMAIAHAIVGLSPSARRAIAAGGAFHPTPPYPKRPYRLGSQFALTSPK